MLHKPLPAYCTSGRALRPGGVVLHYFSARNVEPMEPLEMENCWRLFCDLNRAKSAREWYMRGREWPNHRMYASAHVLIGRWGEVWQLLPFDVQAYHAGTSTLAGRGNCNGWTLGIELVGTNTSKFTSAQYEALSALLDGWMREYGFGWDTVAGHDQVRHAAIQGGARAKAKYDPSGRRDGNGDNFDWQRLRRMAA